MCSPSSGRPSADGAGGLRHPERGLDDGHRPRRPGVRHPVEVAHGLDVGVLEDLLRRLQRRGRHLGRLEQGHGLGLGPAVAPLLHEVVEDVAVLPPQVVVGEARVVEEVEAVDQTAPPLEHGLARDLHQHPAVGDPEQVARGHRGAAVAHARLLDAEQVALDQEGVRHHQRGREQGALDVLAPARGLPVVQRHHRADGEGHRRAEVGVGHDRADGLVGQALAEHRAREHLAGAVEADPVGVGAALAVGRGAGEDDVGLDRLAASRSRDRWPACPQRACWRSRCRHRPRAAG